MSLWDKITGSKSFIPAQIIINPDNIDIKDRLQEPFKQNEQYFLVRINEMYLSYKRKWLYEYDPMVFVLSEFMYDGEANSSVPFVVGPSIVKNKIKIPEGMIFKNTTVAGIHPFRGGKFTLSIVLARLRQKDHARRILGLIETVAGTYTGGFVTMINQYSKVAKVVMDGVDNLLDNSDVDPLIGFRNEYQTSVDTFTPTYFVLINKDEQEINENKFFIKKDSLLYGDSLATAKPYRENDYVLYSVLATKIRDDEESLPFSKQRKELINAIDTLQNVNNDNREIINGKLFALVSALENSPDLTRSQVKELIIKYRNELDEKLALRSNRLSAHKESPAEPQPQDEWKNEMQALSLSILRGERPDNP